MAVPKLFLPDNRGHLDPALDRRLERLGLADRPGQWTERYLLCEQLADPREANVREKFEATSRFIRDLIAHRWVMTRRVRAKSDPKRIHYLSMEFLLGRTLRNNIMNLGADAIVRQAMLQQAWNLEALIEEEPDAGGIEWKRGAKAGYLPQENPPIGPDTVLEAALAGHQIGSHGQSDMGDRGHQPDEDAGSGTADHSQPS